MTNKMSGETLSKKVEADWERVEAALKQFETLIGIGGLCATEVECWLNLTQQQLNKLSPEDCGEGAFLLTQEATFIQCQLNVLQSKMDWCKRRIDKIIAPIIRSQLQRYMDADLKRSLAVQQDDVAEKLQQLYDKTHSYHTRLAYLPTGLRAQADKLGKYQETKRSQNYG